LWPAGKVDVFKQLNNDLVNTYWERQLPSNFSKPGPNASTDEVKRFLTNKYVDKKWADPKMKHDPLYLSENNQAKFQKFLRKRIGGSEPQQDVEP